MLDISKWLMAIITVLFAVAIYAGTFGGERAQFAAAVIFLFVGVISLAAMLLFIGVTLKGNQLSDHPFAFGLPNGSVRAFLAVLLVGLVGVFGTFVFFGVGADRSIDYRTHVLPAPVERAVLQGSLGPDFRVMGVQPEREDPQTKAKVQDVTIGFIATQTGKLDIAKQLVTIVATVLTTVIGFYFGSRASEGRDAAGNPETIGRSATTITAAFVGLNQGARIDAIGKVAEEVIAKIDGDAALDEPKKQAAKKAVDELKTAAGAAVATITAAFGVFEKTPDDGAALAAERDKVSAATRTLVEVEDKLAKAKADPTILAA